MARLPIGRRAVPRTLAQVRLEQLAYELLDAHGDTARLVAAGADEESWEIHLDYLRDLQRVGRELLARAAADERGGASRCA